MLSWTDRQAGLFVALSAFLAVPLDGQIADAKKQIIFYMWTGAAGFIGSVMFRNAIKKLFSIIIERFTKEFETEKGGVDSERSMKAIVIENKDISQTNNSRLENVEIALKSLSVQLDTVKSVAEENRRAAAKAVDTIREDMKPMAGMIQDTHEKLTELFSTLLKDALDRARNSKQ